MNIVFNLSEIVVGVIGLAILGFFAFIGYGTQFRKKEQEQGEREADRLIKLLDTTVRNLKGEVDTLSKDLLASKREISRLTDENAIITKILQGRDGSTEDFQHEAMELIKSMHVLVSSLTEEMTRLCTLLEKRA